MVGSIHVVVARFVIFPRVSISTSSKLIATKRYYLQLLVLLQTSTLSSQIFGIISSCSNTIIEVQGLE
jgi:hypothetical protein